jgi:hypothetical protein
MVYRNYGETAIDLWSRWCRSMFGASVRFSCHLVLAVRCNSRVAAILRDRGMEMKIAGTG